MNLRVAVVIGVEGGDGRRGERRQRASLDLALGNVSRGVVDHRWSGVGRGGMPSVVINFLGSEAAPMINALLLLAPALGRGAAVFR